MKVVKYAQMGVGTNGNEIDLDFDKVFDCITHIERTNKILGDCHDVVNAENDRIEKLGFDDVIVRYNLFVDYFKRITLSIEITYDKGRKERHVMSTFLPKFNTEATVQDVIQGNSRSFMICNLDAFMDTSLPKEVSNQLDILLSLFADAEKIYNVENIIYNLREENIALVKLCEEQTILIKELLDTIKECTKN